MPKGTPFLDPDYRRYPWNESSLAPKNRVGFANITALSFIIAAIGLAPFVIPSVQDGTVFKDLLPYKFILSPIILLVVWWFSGTLLRFGFYLIVKRAADRRKAAKLEREVGNFSLSAKTFEREVADLITFMSGYKTEVVGKAGDQGIDIRILKGSQLVGIAQCKYYDPLKTLTPNNIRELYAVKQKAKVKKAYLVTTARFSSQAVAEAASFEIDLIDGARLRELKEKALRSQIE